MTIIHSLAVNGIMEIQFYIVLVVFSSGRVSPFVIMELCRCTRDDTGSRRNI